MTSPPPFSSLLKNKTKKPSRCPILVCVLGCLSCLSFSLPDCLPEVCKPSHIYYGNVPLFQHLPGAAGDQSLSPANPTMKNGTSFCFTWHFQLTAGDLNVSSSSCWDSRFLFYCLSAFTLLSVELFAAFVETYWKALYITNANPFVRNV